MSSVEPIVEFFPYKVSNYDDEEVYFFDIASSDIKKGVQSKQWQRLLSLRETLKKTYGIYSFYDSMGKVIYVGSAKDQTLWKRMTQSILESKKDHNVFLVNHVLEKGREEIAYSGSKISRTKMSTWESVAYFSVYKVNCKLINRLESLIIHMFPNDILNTRMEQGLSAWKKD